MVNPAIRHREIMSLILGRMDKESVTYWNHLHERSKNECTHKHEDGSSSWIQFAEDTRVCGYCSNIRHLSSMN